MQIKCPQCNHDQMTLYFKHDNPPPEIAAQMERLETNALLACERFPALCDGVRAAGADVVMGAVGAERLPGF